MIVTCRTPGCANADQPIVLAFADDDGQPIVPDTYVCGVCGQTITDLVPPEPYAADGPQDA